MVGIKLASPATGTPILYTYTGLKLETMHTHHQAIKLWHHLTLKLKFNAPKRDTIYLYIILFLFTASLNLYVNLIA